MSGTIFSSTIFNSFKETLDSIVDDRLGENESALVCKKWMKVGSMDEAYVDDLEMGGPGLAAETDEGEEITVGTIREGFLKRYVPRKFALKLIVTDEAMEDNKYPETLRLAKRLDRAIYKTFDIDATNILIRAANTSYVGGDGVPLASAAHTLPSGGTFSNTLAVPMAPSVLALATVRSLVMKLPGHDGITEGYDIKKVVFPTEQWAVWKTILGSEKSPEAGNYAAINSVYDLDVKPVPVKYWNNTTTNWAVITDVDNGVQSKWRRKPKSNSWVENDNETMKYSVSARWATGWSDARGFFFSAA
jgi:hypothetical protein